MRLSLVLFAFSLQAANFYVDPVGGSDAGVGSQSAPWKTIAKVNSSSFSGDDFIYLKCGGIWAETLTIPSSGTSGHPITFTNYGTGNLPLIAGVVSSSKNYVTVDGIQNNGPSGVSVSVNNSIGFILKNSTFQNSPANHTIQLNGTNTLTQILNNTIIDGASRPVGGTGITCLNTSTCNGIIVDGNTIQRFGDVRKFGIIIYDSDNVIIRNNKVTLNDIGIQIHNAHHASIGGKIYRNQIISTRQYTGGDGEGVELTGCAPSTLSVCPAPDAASSFLVTADVYNNFFDNHLISDGHDALGAVVQQNVRVYNNVVIGPFAIGFHPSSTCASGLYYGNSIYGALIGIQVDVGCTSNILKNNIIINSSTYGLFAHATATGSVEDYNDVYNSHAGGGLFATPGTHSITSNPMIRVSPPTLAEHFNLQSSSPAINGGTPLGSPFANYFLDQDSISFPLPSISTDGSWDIGAFAYFAPPSVGGTANIIDASGSDQTARVVSFGRIFKDGDFPTCLQPSIAGTAVSSYQVDVRNRYPSGSVLFAVISFVAPTFVEFGNLKTTFISNASCNNSGYLTQAQMLAFNGGTWNADMQVSANGATVTIDSRTMLAASNPASNTFNDCKVNYLKQGPVETQVLIQDCATGTQDFGWLFSSPAMSTICTKGTNGSTCSNHPWFVLTFQPSTNLMKVDFFLENDFPARAQDQVLSINYRTNATTRLGRACGRILTDFSTVSGSKIANSATGAFTSSYIGCPIEIGPNVSVIRDVISPTSLLMTDAAFTTGTNQTGYINDLYSGAIWWKTFWIGTAPGDVRIDHDQTYLNSTKALYYYDLTKSVSPVNDYTAFLTYDRGENGGTGLSVRDLSSNSEGKPLQREDLLLYYNMKDCSIKGGNCEKAYKIGFGDDSTGGNGQYRVFPSIRLRESRAGTFYCPGFDKNAVPSTACGGSISGIGKPISRHAHPTSQFTGVILPDSLTAVGTRTLGGWSAPDCSHWLNYTYFPYLLTGDFYYLEAQQMAGAFCLATLSPNRGGGESNGFYGYINPSPIQARWFAWGLQEVARAAFLSPDGTVEKSYFINMLNSNLEIQEGFLGITGTALTPSSTNQNCTSFNYQTANRWDWGHCLVQSQCYNTGTNCAVVIPNTLHFMSTGACSTGGSSYVDTTKSKVFGAPWHDWFIGTVLGHINELGFSQALPTFNEGGKRLTEMVLDPGSNPYLVAVYNDGAKDFLTGGQTCTNGNITDRDPYFTSWSGWKSALPSSIQSIASFLHGTVSDPPWANFECTDHAYSLTARAFGTFIQGISSGTLSGAAAQTWLLLNVPFFNSSPGCGTSDAQIGFALAVRPGASICTINTTSLPNGTVSLPYSQTISTTNCGSVSFTVSAGSLPPSLSISSGGTISGTPTVSGNFSFTVKTGITTKALTIQINPAPTVIDVTAHGATGNGTTDDTAAINTSIGLLAAGNTLFFPCGTYLITSALTTISLDNVTVTGPAGMTNCATIKLGGASSFTGMTLAGAGAGTSRNLASDANMGDNQFTTVAGGLSGIVVGDYVLVQDIATASNGPGSPLIASQEMTKITAISSNTATIAGTLSYSFTTANGGFIQKMTTGRNNVHVTYLNFDALSNTGTGTIGLKLSFCVNSELGWLKLTNFLGTGASGGVLADWGYNNNVHDITEIKVGGGGSSGNEAMIFSRQSYDTVSNISITQSSSQHVFSFALHWFHWGTISNVFVDHVGAIGRGFKFLRSSHNTLAAVTANNTTGGTNGFSITDISQYNTFNTCIATGNDAIGIALFGNQNSHNTFNNCTSRYNRGQLSQGIDSFGNFNDHFTTISGGTFCCTRFASANLLQINSNNFTISGASVYDDNNLAARGVVLGTGFSNATITNNTFSSLPTNGDIFFAGSNTGYLVCGNSVPNGTTPSGLNVPCSAPPPNVCVLLTTSPLTNGGTTLPYAAQLTSSATCSAPVYSVVSGTLPPGLGLNSASGLLSGTPTTAGTYNFSVKVLDSTGGTGTTAYSLVITATPPCRITTASLAGGNVSLPYNRTVNSANCTAPLTFSVSAGSLPTGLSLSSGTGVISGTPSAAGTFTFTISLTDNLSHVASPVQFSILIGANINVYNGVKLNGTVNQ